MRIQVRLFSLLRERAGTAQAELELPPGADLAEALRRLEARFPPLEPLLRAHSGLPVRFAVNREYAGSDARLSDGDELALFPPVSGGAATADVLVPTVHATDPNRGLLLLSGGFDSPVAGHMVLAGGRRLDAVHYTMEPFTDDASAKKARVLAHRLGLPRVLIVPLGEDLAEFTRHCRHNYYFVLLKRLMVRVAQELAARHGASFLVTGENLGQVSSQTLSNMGVIDAVARLPILRPLLGLDKNDIINVAKKIGTYETSRGHELCDVLGPRHPVTSSELPNVVAEESKVDVDALVQNALTKAFFVDASPILEPGEGRGLAC